MSIRHISYLACDLCLEICDGADGDTAAEARAYGRRAGWVRQARTPYSKAVDVCPKCQEDPTRNIGWRS